MSQGENKLKESLNKLKENVLFFAPFFTALFVIYYYLQPIEGLIGHDFRHQLPRLFIGAFHFWQNGLAVPHYTPSLCGGIPLFADPQSMYYSLPQLLTLFLDPLRAIHLSNLCFYLVGYILGCSNYYACFRWVDACLTWAPCSLF